MRCDDANTSRGGAAKRNDSPRGASSAQQKDVKARRKGRTPQKKSVAWKWSDLDALLSVIESRWTGSTRRGTGWQARASGRRARASGRRARALGRSARILRARRSTSGRAPSISPGAAAREATCSRSFRSALSANVPVAPAHRPAQPDDSALGPGAGEMSAAQRTKINEDGAEFPEALPKPRWDRAVPGQVAAVSRWEESGSRSPRRSPRRNPRDPPAARLADR